MIQANQSDRLLTIEEVGEWLQMSKGALAQLRYEGTGPEFIKLTGKAVRYQESDVQAWLAGRKASSTKAAA